MFAVAVHVVLTPAAHMEYAAHGAQGATAVTDQVEPSTHGASHTVFDVCLQMFFTPAVPHEEVTVQSAHGALPESENVEPAMHAILHTVSAVWVQMVIAPSLHDDAAVHVVQGSFPVAENDVPDTHGTWHSLFDSTYPLSHVEQSPFESQSVHPVLLPLGPQQLPPRQTPLKQELLEEHVIPSRFSGKHSPPPPPLGLGAVCL